MRRAAWRWAAIVLLACGGAPPEQAGEVRPPGGTTFAPGRPRPSSNAPLVPRELRLEATFARDRGVAPGPEPLTPRVVTISASPAQRDAPATDR